VLLCAALACACTADPAEAICPEAGAGDLVVTEVRGEQSGGDSWGQWIEVQNKTGAALDLHGTVVELVSMNGSIQLRMLVRRELPVAPGEYVVLGAAPDGARPEHMDYGFGSDFETEDDPTQFPGGGAVTVSGCGVQLDRVVFDELPVMGTWSLDEDGTWCADTTPGTGTELGLPGTPGEANTPCP
jgi:hypothetical protein